MRIVLFTGKGGVGKTTVAAATATLCAHQGRRTLVLSTDPAHSLADSFGVEIGDEPTEIDTRLAAQQLDARVRTEAAWDDIRAYLIKVFDWAGAEAIEAEELAVVPGLDEVFSLVDIKEHAASGDWDVLIVDCAPTAETIRLLSLPDVLDWYMERLFPLGRRVNRLVGPVVGRLTDLPVAGDEVFSAGGRLYERLSGVKELLTDPQVSSARLVMNPEKMVIAEARRTHTYLSLFGYRLDAVVANRVLPPSIDDPWFARWKEAQAEHLASIDEGFAPMPVLRAHLAENEVIGPEALLRLGVELYGQDDPAAILHEGDPVRFCPAADGPQVQVDVPGAGRGDVDVARHGDELLITVGPYRRALVLPDSYRPRPVTAAHLDDGTLTVQFGSPSDPRGGT